MKEKKNTKNNKIWLPRHNKSLRSWQYPPPPPTKDAKGL